MMSPRYTKAYTGTIVVDQTFVIDDRMYELPSSRKCAILLFGAAGGAGGNALQTTNWHMTVRRFCGYNEATPTGIRMEHSASRWRQQSCIRKTTDDKGIRVEIFCVLCKKYYPPLVTG
jgi:hypothetical protein